MIGKYARGFRHLKRIVGSSKTKKIFILQNSRILECVGFICPYSNHLIIFQNMGGETDLYKIPSEYRTLAESLLSKYNRYYIVKDSRALFQFGRKYFVVDDDFDEQYESFQKNNKKLLDQVYNKFCYPNDNISCFMFGLIGNSPNLYVWALTNYFKNGITMYTIEHIVNFNNKYNQLVKKLSRGTITAYNSREKVNNLINEIVQLRSVKRANDSINLFNTAQKKLLKTIEMNDTNVHILNRFGTLSNVKKRNFVRKMSTIENIDEIMRQMSLLTNIHFEWNRESLLDFVKNNENIKCEIVLDDNNIVLVKVFSYDTIKLLAKTTNWCISKNKRYWNDYVEHRRDSIQFVMFDFNKPEDHELSIVGFTSAKNNGITNAHSYSNANLMGNGYGGRVTNLSSFLNQNTNNIYSIIKGNKIPLGKIINANNLNYSWNFNSFLAFLNCTMSEDEYIIHYMDNEDNKIVFSSKSEKLTSIITNRSFVEMFEMREESSSFEIFVFVDFNYDKDDSESLRYAQIYPNRSTNEEYSSEVFDCFGCSTNTSFDEMLENFGLPYDTICRTDDKVKRFESYFRNYNIKSLNQLISDKDIIETLKSDRNSNFYQSSGYTLYESIFSFRSFDYINMIYNNGYKISDFINDRNFHDLITSLLYEISNHYRYLGRIPTEEDFESLNKNVFNDRQRIYVGYFKILNDILNYEQSDSLYKKIGEIFNGISHHRELDKFLLKYILPFVEFKKLDDKTKYIIRCISNFNIKEFNEIVLSKKINKDVGGYFLISLSTNHDLYNHFNEKYGVKDGDKSTYTQKGIDPSSITWSFITSNTTSATF